MEAITYRNLDRPIYQGTSLLWLFHTLKKAVPFFLNKPIEYANLANLFDYCNGVACLGFCEMCKLWELIMVSPDNGHLK